MNCDITLVSAMGKWIQSFQGGEFCGYIDYNRPSLFIQEYWKKLIERHLRPMANRPGNRIMR